MSEQNEMLEIVTPMMEYVCDKLCIYPVKCNEWGGLDNICTGCQMDKYTNDILNQYKINNFEKGQCAHLLKELAMERARRENMVADWKWHLTQRFSLVN